MVRQIGAGGFRRMCRVEKGIGSECGEREMRVKAEKLKVSAAAAAAAAAVLSRPRMKMWMARAAVAALLWTCVVQLTAVGGIWGPAVLKGWPSCSAPSQPSAADKLAVLPPKSESLLNKRYTLNT